MKLLGPSCFLEAILRINPKIKELNVIWRNGNLYSGEEGVYGLKNARQGISPVSFSLLGLLGSVPRAGIFPPPCFKICRGRPTFRPTDPARFAGAAPVPPSVIMTIIPGVWGNRVPDTTGADKCAIKPPDPSTPPYFPWWGFCWILLMRV